MYSSTLCRFVFVCHVHVHVHVTGPFSGWKQVEHVPPAKQFVPPANHQVDKISASGSLQPWWQESVFYVRIGVFHLQKILGLALSPTFIHPNQAAHRYRAQLRTVEDHVCPTYRLQGICQTVQPYNLYSPPMGVARSDCASDPTS